MSLNWIFIFTLICISSIVKTQDYEDEGEEEEDGDEMFTSQRICIENRDYVDASVMFRDRFWVIVGRIHYEFVYNKAGQPFVYHNEAVHEIFLNEYDKTLKIPGDEPVKTGRMLGGFYHDSIALEEEEDTELVDIYNKLDVDQGPFWAFLRGNKYDDESKVIKSGKLPLHVDGVKSLSSYWSDTQYRQTVFFKDEHTNKDKYHIKKQMHPAYLIDLEPDVKSFHGVPRRGSLESFLDIPDLPPRLETLPIIYDLSNFTLFVIVNQRDSNGVPRLYYNSFKYENTNFTHNWKYVDIPKGYRYNAFIPFRNSEHILFFPSEGFERDMVFSHTYKVIAEPFRDTKNDRERGPSFLFELVVNNKTGIPSLKKLERSGMSVFGCKFIPPSSEVLYIVFGVLLAILFIILISMMLLVVVNYCIGKGRIIIVGRSRGKISRGASVGSVGTASGGKSKRSSLDSQSKRRTDDDNSIDKRSDVESYADQKPSDSPKKIKI